jgi:hypothetical protein
MRGFVNDITFPNWAGEVWTTVPTLSACPSSIWVRAEVAELSSP